MDEANMNNEANTNQGADQQKAKRDFEFHQATIMDEYGQEIPADTPANKVKGLAQMAAGGALMAVGVPMLILPGPGALSIVGGAAIAAKGHRDFTGREATDVERVVDNLASQLGETVRTQTEGLGKKAAQVAGEAVGNTVHAAADAAEQAASKRFDPEKVHAVRAGADAAVSSVVNTATAAVPVAQKTAKAVASTATDLIGEVSKMAAGRRRK